MSLAVLPLAQALVVGTAAAVAAHAVWVADKKRASMLRSLQKSPTWRVPLWRRSRTWRLHRKVNWVRVVPSFFQRRDPFW